MFVLVKNQETELLRACFIPGKWRMGRRPGNQETKLLSVLSWWGTKKLNFSGRASSQGSEDWELSGCIFYTFAPCGSRRHASKKLVAKMRVLYIGFSRSCRNRVGTIGTALETVVETIVNYIETVEFLYWRPDLDPLDRKSTVSMWFTTVSTTVSRAVPTVPTRFLQLLEKPI